jgi:hypothetical protein
VVRLLQETNAVTIVALVTLALAALTFIVALLMMQVCAWHQTTLQQRVNRCGARLADLDSAWREQGKRLADIERRLELIGLPDQPDDVALLRRLIEALLMNMIQDQREADWWKHGQEPP